MQNKADMEIKTKWDLHNSILLTNKIYRLVNKHKIKAKIEAKPGSIELFFAISVILDLYTLFQLVRGMRKYVKNRRSKYKEKTKKELPAVIITYFNLKKQKYVRIEI